MASSSTFSFGCLADDFDAYAVGSILYMRLDNFITYDHCEMYPGPHMNMLIGPNGSGKSSIVAGVALGLGWHPGVLGRSKDVAEFIKYGRERALLEIALKCPPGDELLELLRDAETEGMDGIDEIPTLEDGREQVLVLRREITRKATAQRQGHSSEWYLNGAPATAKLINVLVKVLQIQVDNLCQFLPQDKVSEFARMTRTEMLMETEKAAGDPSMVVDHQRLIELRGKEVELQATTTDSTNRLASLQKQNEAVEELILRAKEREKHIKVVELCEMKRPWLQYNAARDAYMGAKERRDVFKEQLDQAEGHLEPIRNELKSALLEQEREKRLRSSELAQLDSLLAALEQQLHDEAQKCTFEQEQIRAKIFRIRAARKKRFEEINEMQGMIHQLQEEIKQIKVVEDPAAAYQGEMAKVASSMESLENSMQELQATEREISRNGDRYSHEIDTCNKELRQLDDYRHQRLQIVRNRSQDVYATYMWLQEKVNADLFHERVYGPLCMDINVAEGMGDLVKSVIPSSQLLSFVVGNMDDYEVFMRHIIEEHRWKVTVTIVEDVSSIDLSTPPLSQSLKAAGFTGLIAELVDAPPLVKAALIDSARIHLVPYAKGGIRVRHDVAESINNLSKYVCTEGCFEIRRSHYSSDVAVNCTKLKNASYFTRALGEERRAQIQERITSIRTSLEKGQVAMRKLIEEKQKIRSDLEAFSKQKEEIQNKILQGNQALLRLSDLKKRLKMRRNNLAALRDIANNHEDEDEEQELKAELIASMQKSKQICESALRDIKEGSQLATLLAQKSLSSFGVDALVLRLQETILRSETQNTALRASLAEAEDQVNNCKIKAKELLEMASQIDIDENTRSAFGELPDTIDELERLLATERAMLEASHDGAISAVTMREFKLRKEQIATLQRDSKSLNEQLRAIQEEMETIHNRWLPSVNDMILSINERFSGLFTRMGCAGQVRLHQEGRDYVKWELEILVRFRDDEQLQLLSAHRQSGGEKSVSTILYLLSLQELARSPFRVVDEINQGMDANNERRVHSLIVETATSTSRSSQYFLITPKLLTGLTYHERMHILCVFNGEGVLSDLSQAVASADAHGDDRDRGDVEVCMVDEEDAPIATPAKAKGSRRRAAGLVTA